MNQEQSVNELVKYLIMPLLSAIFFSLLLGIPIGIVISLFKRILSLVNQFRSNHEYLVYGLPVAGVLISYLYVKAGRNAYSGENLLKSDVLQASKDIPVYMVLVVFLGSLLTTFFCGSEPRRLAIHKLNTHDYCETDSQDLIFS